MDKYNVVSYVNFDSDTPTLVVENAPFLYLGTQLSPHRLLHFGWSWDDMEKLFQTAADNHFTVLAVPVLWNWIEPYENKFQWLVIDCILDFAYKYGLRLEILWFGSNVCGKSLVHEGCPQWVLDKFEKIKGQDGSLYSTYDFCYVSYQYTTFYKLDICDSGLLTKEQYAISSLLNYISKITSLREYYNIVIGVQILNEPTCCKLFDSENTNIPDLDRSYSNCANKKWERGGYSDPIAFNIDMFWEYLNGLASSVKKSEYSVWTRVNMNKNYEGFNFVKKLVAKNEAMRDSVGTFLDFIGDDPYTEDIEEVHNYGINSIFSIGKNLPMIMENGGHYEITDQLIFNALAGGACYNIWELITSGEAKWQTGFYEVDHSEKRIRAKWYQSKIKSLNSMLIKDYADLALLKPRTGRLVFFNREFFQTSETSCYINSYKIRYITGCGGGGIAIARKDYLVFMSTTDAQFSISGQLSVRSLEKGLYNHDDNWISHGRISYSTTAQNITFNIDAHDCIRLAYEV